MTYFMPKKYDLTILFSLHFTIWRLKNINSEETSRDVKKCMQQLQNSVYNCCNMQIFLDVKFDRQY